MRLIIAKIGKAKTVSFAAEELIRLIKKMDKNLRLDVRQYKEKDLSVKNALWIGLDGSVTQSEDDQILIKVENGAGIITGSNERSVLMAAYRFMYELGCRYLYPGADGEKIPTRTLNYKDLSVLVDETPSYPHRIMCIEGSVSYEHVYNMIDWLPKVGMSGFYTQFFVPTVFFDRYYKRFYEDETDRDYGNKITDDDISAMMNMLNDELTKRDIYQHAIGHGWSSAPYGLVASGWDIYTGEISDELRNDLALYKGKRDFFEGKPLCTQLCYSSDRVKHKVTDYAVEFCKNNPNIDCLDFTLGDGGRNHCECEECRKKYPSDHYVDMLNMLDEKLTAAGLPTKLKFSVYADTLFAPKQEKLRDSDRFILGFAPIARSYSQSYDEVDLDNLPETAPFIHNKDMLRNTVALNVAYLSKWQENYKGDALVWDYHLMWDHHTDPGYYNIVKTINRDIASLGKLKLNGLLSCQLLRSAFPTGFPQYCIATNLFNKERSFEEIRDEYFTAAFGDMGKTVSEYLAEISDLACPEFVRGKIIPGFKEFSRDELTLRYTKLKEVVKAFSEKYIQKFKDLSVDWQYLNVHSVLVILFANIYIARYNGDEEKVTEFSNKFREYVKENENIIDAVCDDMYLCDDVLGKFLDRHHPDIEDDGKPIFYEY